MVRAVSFDLDGTLYSSEPIIEDAYREAVIEFNKLYDKSLIPPTFSQIESLIGQPVYKIYKTLFPGLTEEEISIIGSIIINILTSKILREGGLLFDGVKDVFYWLNSNNYMVFIASNGRREYIDAVLNKFDLVCMPFVCIGEKGIAKKSDILFYYMKEYDISSSEMIMVGDRKSDIEAAREAGVKFVGCLFGHGDPNEINGSDFFIKDITEIKDVIGKVYA